MTAWRDTPDKEIARPEIIPLLSPPLRTWTPGFCVTRAGDRPRSANTPPGTWRTPNAKTWAQTHGGLHPPQMSLKGTPRIWFQYRGPTLATEMRCLPLRVLQDGVGAPLLQIRAVPAGETAPTATKHLLEQVDGAALQQGAKTLICPKMEPHPG